MPIEELRRRFEEMLRAYRQEPELEGHRILELEYPVVRVLSNNGNEYKVNLEYLTCTCEGYRRWHRCKHLLFVIREVLNGNISIPEEFQEERLRDISRYIGSYNGGATGTSRSISVAVIGTETFGCEVEVKFQSFTTRLGDELFDKFLELGGVVERDASVDLEFKSPILVETGVLIFSLNPFWKRIEELQDKNYYQQGIHVHIGWDDVFAVGKRPNSSSLTFLNSLAAKLEKAFSFEKVFWRKPNRYCQTISNQPDPLERYRWINFRPLRRSVGKTLEIRGVAIPSTF